MKFIAICRTDYALCCTLAVSAVAPHREACTKVQCCSSYTDHLLKPLASKSSWGAAAVAGVLAAAAGGGAACAAGFAAAAGGPAAGGAAAGAAPGAAAMLPGGTTVQVTLK